MDEDIVTILRDWGTRVVRILDDENTPSKMLTEAADEIERLRSICKEAQEFIDHNKNCAYLIGRTRNCSCGFDKMWSRLDEAPRAEE